MTARFDFEVVRSQFPALSRTVAGKPALYLDGPAGTQVPRCVADAMSDYLLHHNANHGGFFLTSVETDQIADEARSALADFMGVSDRETIVFGPNMTSITFQISRALARTWSSGDEIIVSDSDHDANVTPWKLAARDAGVHVHQMRLNPADGTLDLPQLQSLLTNKTKLVAVGCASNATGTIHPVGTITQLAHKVGALVYLDAVHFAPHGLLSFDEWDCDFMVCSAYKFFGPHAGILSGKRHLLESLPAYKVRPASNAVPDRWMTGTPNFEAIAGSLAAVNYMATIGAKEGDSSPRREVLRRAMEEIIVHERELANQFLAGVKQKSEYRVWGIADPQRWSERVPTFSITSTKESPIVLAKRLAEEGIFVWHGNFYALPLTEALGLEPEGMVRIGFVHYNTPREIERLLAVL